MIKEIIALIFLLGFSIPTVRLLYLSRLNVKSALTILLFSLLGAFAISNYDVIQKFKWGSVEVETARKEITKIKEGAIEDIKSEIGEQRESIKLLISNANDTRDKMEQQKKSLSDIIKTAYELQKKIEEQKIAITKLNQEGLRTKSEIEKLNKASAEVALILVRATYLTLATKSEFGTDRSKKAIELVLKDLDKIVPMVISDEKERANWIQNLLNSLPPRGK